MNIKVGSCTGYPSAIVETLKPIAAAQGYIPDVYVAADEVPQARPMPYMVGSGGLGTESGDLCEGWNNYVCDDKVCNFIDSRSASGRQEISNK